MMLSLAEAASTAISVGLGCGACCGTSASAFLSAYILSEGRGLKAAFQHTVGFLSGKILSVAAVCAAASALGSTLTEAE